MFLISLKPGVTGLEGKLLNALKTLQAYRQHVANP